MKTSTRWLAGAAVALALVGGACGDSDSDTTTTSTSPAPSAAAAAATNAPTSAAASTTPATAATSMTKAADLRTALNGLLNEHVALVSSATAGALGGRQAQFDAAAAQLDGNSVDMAKAIGSIYGAPAEQAFLPLWRKHIGFFVEYTQATAAKDQAKQDKAIADLTQYAEDSGAFFAAANPNLPKDAVAGLFKMHIGTLKDMVDAQAANDQVKAYAATRTAFAHMPMMAEPVAAAVAQQLPDKYPGNPGTKASALRSTLNVSLREHMYLAARATGAAIGGRDAEFTAAANSLDGNSVDLSKAIGSVYGADSERAFLPLWRKHIGFVVDYTTGVATKDQAKADKAVADLTAYTQEIGAFFNSANGLPKDAVASLIGEHVLTLKSVIDAQAAGNQPKVYGDLRAAMGHMPMVADPLAEATVKKFPDQFTS
jgi:hypothetical protein